MHVYTFGSPVSTEEIEVYRERVVPREAKKKQVRRLSGVRVTTGGVTPIPSVPTLPSLSNLSYPCPSPSFTPIFSGEIKQ